MPRRARSVVATTPSPSADRRGGRPAGRPGPPASTRTPTTGSGSSRPGNAVELVDVALHVPPQLVRLLDDGSRRRLRRVVDRVGRLLTAEEADRPTDHRAERRGDDRSRPTLDPERGSRRSPCLGAERGRGNGEG